MSNKICDHTSVGILVYNDDRILLIERKKFPFGFAIPAGHVDGDATFEIAAKRELSEEVGLNAEHLELVLERRMENGCRREGGTWHMWKIFKADVSGMIKLSNDETRSGGWYTKEQILPLADRTLKYLNKQISEEDWQQNPGMEPVMLEFFTELGIVAD
ncbi:MAG: NUDIX hydrolase [Patescibacteria group bacterium]|nr:NUDIX hydrolase [Patescibacteria group bacterium]